MRSCLTPIAILAAILAFALWNGANMTDLTARWRDQLQQVDALAQSEDWTGALEALSDFPRDELSASNRLTWDILCTQLQNELALAAYPYYEEALSPLLGIQAQLPTLLAEYSFASREDTPLPSPLKSSICAETSLFCETVREMGYLSLLKVYTRLLSAIR